MMKKSRTVSRSALRRYLPALGLALSAALGAGAAQAQSAAKSAEPAFYGEIGYTGLNEKEPGLTLHPKQLRLVAGADLHPNLAIEGLLGVNAGDDSVTLGGDEYKLKVDHIFGLYLKPKVAVTPEIELFGRVGFARSKVTTTSTFLSLGITDKQSSSDNDFSYGVGASYAVSDKMFLSLDYMSYYNKDDLRIRGVNVGLGMKF